MQLSEGYPQRRRLPVLLQMETFHEGESEYFVNTSPGERKQSKKLRTVSDDCRLKVMVEEGIGNVRMTM